jgi:hypothetical protein
MTSQEFVDLSTRLVADLRAWVLEVGKEDSLSAGDLETLRAATRVVERVTVREAQEPPPTGGPTML